VAHTDTKDRETSDSGESRPSTRRAATQARMGLAQGHGGLMDRARWAGSGVGQQPAKIELGQRVKGAATNCLLG
jgi:hypothetical protein